ncbi:MAG: penicillin-binding protein activator [Desulfuromonas thiophila]|nr:penicillin-binding protein activator [Desulfuromonas thiophila]
MMLGRGIALVALLLTLLPAVWPGGARAQDGAAEPLAAVRQLVAAGQIDAAQSQLRQLLLESTEDVVRQEAMTLLADLLWQQQLPEQALAYARRLPPAVLSPDLWQALVAEQISLGQFDAAQQLLDSRPVPTNAASAPERLRLQLRLAQARGQQLQALMLYSQLLQQPAAADEGLWHELETLVRQLPAAERAEAEFMFAGTGLEPLLQLPDLREQVRQSRQLAADAPERRTLTHQLSQLLAAATAPALRQQLVALLDQLNGTPWQRRAIGVLLPLTGRYAPFGQMVRQGMELAAAQAGADAAELLFRDSAADPARAVDELRQLVEQERVLAVLGPLSSEAAQACAPLADQLQVPLLSLSHWPDLPAQGAYVFRHSLTSRLQVETLLDYSFGRLGLTRYAILQPDNSSGERFARLFAEAVRRRGGQVHSWQRYAEQATDFRPQLLALRDLPAGLDAGSLAVADREQHNRRQQGLPTLGFEALFLPDYAEQIALLAPQLVYYGIEGVQLLGIHGWRSEQLQQQAGPYVAGALFCDGFCADGARPAAQRFVRDYQARYGEPPTLLEAQGYDCARLLLQLVRQCEAPTPALLREELLRPDPLRYQEMVSGLSGFAADGEAQVQLCLLRFGNRGIEPLPPAGVPLP